MTIQKVINDGLGAYKSTESAAKASWGVERVNFDGLAPGEEFRTHLLSNGDSRFLFRDGLTPWIYAINTTAATSNSLVPGVFPDNINLAITQTAANPRVYGELEISFYGNDINLLVARGLLDNATESEVILRAYVDGEDTPRTTITENSNTDGDAATISNRTFKPNTVVPLRLSSGSNTLAVGNHTVRIEIIYVVASGGGRALSKYPLFGCEIINSQAITANSDLANGSVFSDGYRYNLTSETGLPIIPSSYTYTSSGGGTARGARIVNYLNPLDKTYEQVIEVIPESSTVDYQATRNAAAAVTWTIPNGITSFNVRMIGSGGAGGNARTNNNSSSGAEQNFAYSGAGGGSGSYYSADYTVSSGTTNRVRITVGAGGIAGASNGNPGAAGGTTLIEGSINSGSTFSNLVSLSGGGGAQGGSSSSNSTAAAGGTASAVTASTVTGFAASNASSIGGGIGSVGGIGGGFPSQQGTCQFSSGGAGADAANNTVDNLGGTGGGGIGGIITSSTTGQEMAASGGSPFGAGGGGGAGRSAQCGSELNEAGLAGAPARIIITFTGTSGLGDQGAGFIQVVDHSNEEIIKKVYWREFGNNSEFATLTGNDRDRSFTLNDGTTTLYSNNIDVIASSVTNRDALSFQLQNDFLTLTFIGTGLDIVRFDGVNTLTNGVTDIRIDGSSIGRLNQQGVDEVTIEPVVSGLPYGTHTIEFIQTSAGNSNFNPSLTDFIIYGPKKPTIPTSAIEIADYNIMADYSRNTSRLNNAVSIGTIGKSSSQSFSYNGAVTYSSDRPTSPYGQHVTLGSNDYFTEFTFYGTGVELICSYPGSAVVRQVEVFLDRDSSGNFEKLGSRFTVNTVGKTSAYTSSTSFWDTGAPDTTTSRTTRLQVTGMPLGIHTIRIERETTGGIGVVFAGAEVICPIHYQDNDLEGGANGVKDVRGPLIDGATDGAPILFQRKTLGTSIFTSNFDISDLTFNNLEIGKIYRLSGNTVIGGGGDNGNMEFYDATGGSGNRLGSTGRDFGVGTGTMYQGVNIIFTAKTSSMVSRTRSMAGGVAVRDTQTFLILEELPNHIETRKW